tara:strand:+ start:66 stop:341 length:276 start_codon:yes stop_codon:yes gene_type:complete
MINKDTKFKISPDVVISEINNESVIMNLNTGIYFQVNELGSFIISELKNYQNIAMLQEKIILSFDVSSEACKDDLENFLEILLEKNLLLTE